MAKKYGLLSMNSLMTGVKGLVVGIVAGIPAMIVNLVLTFGLSMIHPALSIVGMIVAFAVGLMLWGYIWNRLPDFS